MLRPLLAASLLLAFVAVAVPPAEAVSATVCIQPTIDCATVDPGVGQLIACTSTSFSTDGSTVSATVCV